MLIQPAEKQVNQSSRCLPFKINGNNNSLNYYTIPKMSEMFLILFAAHHILILRSVILYAYYVHGLFIFFIFLVYNHKDGVFANQNIHFNICRQKEMNLNGSQTNTAIDCENVS